MSIFTRNSGRVVCAVMAMFVLAGCGVKSSPGEPEDSTYPLIYPAGAKEDENSSDVERGLRSSRNPTGGYQPPPPATQLPQ